MLYLAKPTITGVLFGVVWPWVYHLLVYSCTVLCFSIFPHKKEYSYTNNKHSTIIGNHNYAWGNIFHSECTYIFGVLLVVENCVGHVHLIRVRATVCVQYHVQIETLWYNLHYLIATPDFFWYDLHVLIATPDFFFLVRRTRPPVRTENRGNLRRRYTSADTKSDELPPKISKFQKLKIPKNKLSRDYCHALRMSLVF